MVNTTITSRHSELLDDRIADVVERAQFLQTVLTVLKEIGPQGTWLGSRKLGPNSPEYKWCVEVARILAEIGIAAKTGGGPGLMEAPHSGCQMAGRPDRAVAVRASFLDTEEEVNPYAGDGGSVFEMPDFNSRHDVLFLGSLFHIVLPGRLGTIHEMNDLLNRLKHGLLAKAPVYFVEREGYWSKNQAFLIDPVGEELGPRISPSDYERTKVINLFKTTPAEFVAMLLSDINWPAGKQSSR